MTNNFEEKDHEKAVILIDAFIQWTNADHEGSITLGRNQCCYMRDEIQRLRALEAQLATAQRERGEARRLAQWTPITETDLPRGRDHLLYAEVEGMDIYGIGYYNRITKSWFINGREEHNPGVTHFRPIAPPEVKP